MKKLYTIFVVFTTCLSSSAQFASGDGLTSETAYIIEKPAQLKYLADNQINPSDATENYWKGKYYKITDDIDMSGITINSIGYVTDAGVNVPFEGTLNGNNHTINNLKVVFRDNQKLDGGLGLFGYGLKITVKNLAVNNATIGDAADIGTRKRIGVIVGDVINSNSKVSNCSVTNSTLYVSNIGGGIIGIITDGTVENCFASNIVFEGSTGNSAGIAGILKNANAFVKHSFSKGVMSVANNKTRIDENIVNVFTDVAGGDGTQITVLEQEASYNGFDFTNTWVMTGDGFARLQSFTDILLALETKANIINSTKVYNKGNTLYINNIPSGIVNYKIYNLSGTLLKIGEAEGTSITNNLSLPKGIYLVVVGGMVTKIVL